MSHYNSFHHFHRKNGFVETKMMPIIYGHTDTESIITATTGSMSYSDKELTPDKKDGQNQIGSAEEKYEEGGKRMKVKGSDDHVNTNINVCVRLRPLLPSDISSRSIIDSNCNKKMEQTQERGQQLPPPAWLVDTKNNTLSPKPLKKIVDKRTFTYDQTYGPNSTNVQLFDLSVRKLVRSAMIDNRHATVFAYGQTNSGKTHTMSGAILRKEGEEGVMQFAIRECFECIKEQREEREYCLRVSFMELYNEVIHDLLTSPSPSPSSKGKSKTSIGNKSTSSPSARSHMGKENEKEKIKIFEKDGNVIVRGLCEEVALNPERVFELLAEGTARRKTGMTAMNERSSRSHSIFRIEIKSRPRTSPLDTQDVESSFWDGTTISGSGPVRTSSLSLVDLAGSECLKATKANEIRQTEGKYINKSLMTLGHVVWKLSEKSSATWKRVDERRPKENNKENLERVTQFNGNVHAKRKHSLEEAGKGKVDGKNRGGSSRDTHIPYRDSKLTRLLQPSLSSNAQICIICNISPLHSNFNESINTLKFASRAKRIRQRGLTKRVTKNNSLLQVYKDEIEQLKMQLREATELVKLANSASVARTVNDDNDSLIGKIFELENLILSETHKETSTEESTKVTETPKGKEKMTKKKKKKRSFFSLLFSPCMKMVIDE